jgi:periplasmic copper chaperone A
VRGALCKESGLDKWFSAARREPGVTWWRLSLAVIACSLGAAAHADVTVSDAWVRALPPTQRQTAAYLTLHNDGAEARQVTGGSAQLAGRVEMHRSEQVDGYMRMSPVTSLPLPPGQSVQLAPGGIHLMLLDLERMPAEGERLELCLTLADGGRVCTLAPVRRQAGGEDHSGHH